MNAQQIHRLRIRTRKLKQQNRALTKQASPAFTGGPLTSKQADDLVRSTVASSKYGTIPQQGLSQQIGASDVRQGQLHDWFGQYLTQVNAAKNNQAQAQAAAVGQIRGDQGTAQASDQAAQAKRDQVAQQLAQVTGGNFDSGRSTEAAAQTNRQSLGDINVAALAKQGAADTTYLGNRASTGAAYETRAHLDEAGRKRKLESDLGTLKGLAGEYGNTVRDQLRQQDFQNQIAQASGLVKQQQLGINEQLAGSLIGSRKGTAKHQKATEKLANRKFSSAEEKDAYSRAHGLGPYKPPKPTKPKGAITHAKKQENQNKYDQAVSTLNLAGKPYVAKKGEAFMRNYLESQKNVPSWLAQAAVQTVLYGGVGPATAKAVRKKFGIKLRQFTPRAQRAPQAPGIRSGTGQAG